MELSQTKLYWIPTAKGSSEGRCWIETGGHLTYLGHKDLPGARRFADERAFDFAISNGEDLFSRPADYQLGDRALAPGYTDRDRRERLSREGRPAFKRLELVGRAAHGHRRT